MERLPLDWNNIYLNDYIKHSLTIRKIAKKYNCSYYAVNNNFRKLSLKRRTTKETRQWQEKSSCWKENIKGRRTISFHGVQVHYHVYIFLQFHNLKFLPSGYCIHHLDENKDNNDINNLILMKHANHTKFHRNKLGLIQDFIDNGDYLYEHSMSRIQALKNEEYTVQIQEWKNI